MLKARKIIQSDNFEDIYIQCLEMISEDPDYTTLGSRSTVFREIISLNFELTNPYNRMVWNPVRKTNYEFAMRFFLWMLNSGEDFNYVAGVNPNAANYIDKSQLEQPNEAKFSTAYGPRIMRQIPTILKELLDKKGSRRAVVSILHEEDLLMLDTDTKVEFPCIESLTFFIRDNKLYCQCIMRSNNMATTVVYDVFCFTMFQEYVLKLYNQAAKENHWQLLTMGSYFHHATSAHIFENQFDFAGAILTDGIKNPPHLFRSDDINK
jgi:thymidylate synthase